MSFLSHRLHFGSHAAPAATISAEERAAIDAAIAAGKVQRIPAGVSGLEQWRWCDRTSSLVSLAPPNTAMAAIRARTAAKARVKYADRDAAVLQLHLQGLSHSAVAEALRGQFPDLTKGIAGSIVRRARRDGLAPKHGAKT